MRQAEDLVWATITGSARLRFDYNEFKNRLSPSADERVADFILFQIIEGFAEHCPPEELSLRISEDLELFGYSTSVDELNAILKDKKEILHAEVHATREALSGFSQGESAPALQEKVQKLLS